MKIIDDLWVCADCLFFLANGDLPEDEDAASAVIAGCEREERAGGHWALDGIRDDEDEGADECDFSWSHCDCCGSSLGGSRYRAAVIYQETPTRAASARPAA